jgi:CHASE1-domain containing sensor protein
VEDNRITNKELGEALIIGLLLIALCVMAFQLRNTQTRLTELERGTSETMTSQQSQIDSLGLYIEGVRDEMQEGFEEHQAQLDSQQEQLNTQKNVQSNTLKAFVRYQKEQAQQNEEFKEELKKD